MKTPALLIFQQLKRMKVKKVTQKSTRKLKKESLEEKLSGVLILSMI
jgi:hypothetical protein